MISLVIPTRNRPDIFKEMCLSVLNTVSNPNDIEFVIYRDEDDESLYEYIGNYKEIRGKRIYSDASANECQKVATGPIILFMPDDIIFLNKGWDEKVKNVFDAYPDKIIFVHFNDHYFRSKYGSIGCLHRNWIDTVGYLFPPGLCRRGDVWINEVSRRINRKVYIKEIGYRDMRIIEDQTHREYVTEIERTKCLENYKSENMKAARIRDARLLQDFINNYGTQHTNTSQK